ncbi:calcium-independent phospholipase A2-gamma-like isoform X2 [Mya arenaria]|nr:calcium-independent phospholipase A2-gamma-like isoform X2 [Mya arenaria]XP_052780752.1 calcium-independent phospholipase A2-gamma-like isoform X2 [Mya arenaria]XP_052780753.1 calcium-independent phospholipase A2-gamma-like isoform X2 [Mya arenaria]
MTSTFGKAVICHAARRQWSYYCPVCRHLFTTVGRKHRNAVHKALKSKKHHQMGGPENSDGHWHRIRSGVTSTVSGLRLSVGNLSRRMRMANTPAVAVNSIDDRVQGSANVEEALEMQKQFENENNQGANVEGEQSVKDHVHGVKRHSEKVRQSIKHNKEEEEHVIPEWALRILESSELNIDDEHFHKYFQTSNSKQSDSGQNKNISKADEGGRNLSERLKERMSYFSRAKEGPRGKDTDSVNANALAKDPPVEIKIEIIQENAESDTKIPSSTPSTIRLTARFKESMASFAKKGSSRVPVVTVEAESDEAKMVKLKEPSPNKTAKDQVEQTYFQYVWSLPQNIQNSLGFSKAAPPVVEENEIAKRLMEELKSDTKIKQRTSSLCDNLVKAQSNLSKRKRLDELCNHLLHFPQFRHIAAQHGVLRVLMKMRESSESPELVGRANETLALIGHVNPPRGRGMKMISFDGGGTRGLIAIEMLLRLEQQSGRPVHKLFDMVIGSSTGALLAGLIFMLRVPLADCKAIYLDRSKTIFSKSSWAKQMKNLAQFDETVFEEIIKKEIGETSLSALARNPDLPKLALTSTLGNFDKWQRFMFRSYNLPVGMVSDHQGTCNARAWEAIRASGAAPLYFKEFRLGNHVFLDGGLLDNNPTHLGIHECKLLWPNEKFQCIVSLGNGRYDPYQQKNGPGTSAWATMSGLPRGFIESATDTETVHQILKDTTKAGSYYRLCPYLSEDYNLAEVKPDKIRDMLQETNNYLDRNEAYMQTIVSKLLEDRHPHQKMLDKASVFWNTHDYSNPWKTSYKHLTKLAR